VNEKAQSKRSAPFLLCVPANEGGVMTIKVRGVRGAITVESNTSEAILEATKALLRTVVDINGIVEDDVASVFFTTTMDLNAVFPAAAARHFGWHRVALMGSQEADVTDGLPRCIRILIHWNTDKSLDDIQHVYMRGAEKLRPDLYPDNKIVLNGGSK
jgi:chorismate mutase